MSAKGTRGPGAERRVDERQVVDGQGAEGPWAEGQGNEKKKMTKGSKANGPREKGHLGKVMTAHGTRAQRRRDEGPMLKEPMA